MVRLRSYDSVNRRLEVGPRENLQGVGDVDGWEEKRGSEEGKSARAERVAKFGSSWRNSLIDPARGFTKWHVPS